MRHLLLFLCFLVPFKASAYDYEKYISNVFHFEAWTFKGHSYEVTVNSSKILVVNSLGGLDIPYSWCSKSVSELTIGNIETTLEKLGVHKWQRKYQDSNVRDGSSFKLSFNNGEGYLYREGINAYPENFDKLIKYIKTLVEINGCEVAL